MSCKKGHQNLAYLVLRGLISGQDLILNQKQHLQACHPWVRLRGPGEPGPESSELRLAQVSPRDREAVNIAALGVECMLRE